MPRFERRVDKHGFPLPAQIEDLPGRDAQRDADQFGNVSFGTAKRELSESGQRWKRRIIWLGIIGVVVGLLLSSFSKPLWELYADVRNEMGIKSFLQGDLHGARSNFDAALWADPENIVAHYYRGKTLYALQELDAAAVDLTRCIESRIPELMLRALDTRAMIHYRQQRPKEALADADQAVNQAPNDAGARNSRAYLCALLGMELKKGLTDIDFALQQYPDNAAFLDTRGYLLFKQGDHHAALADLDRAILQEEKLLHRYQRGLELANSGRRLDINRQHLENKVKETQENLGVMYFHRGEVYEALDKAEEATEEKARGLEFGYAPEKGVF